MLPCSSEEKSNRVQITPLPPSPTSVTTATTLSQSNSVSASERPVIPPLNILSRPKRVIKPSLKALENMSNKLFCTDFRKGGVVLYFPIVFIYPRDFTHAWVLAINVRYKLDKLVNMLLIDIALGL